MTTGLGVASRGLPPVQFIALASCRVPKDSCLPALLTAAWARLVHLQGGRGAAGGGAECVPCTAGAQGGSHCGVRAQAAVVPHSGPQVALPTAHPATYASRPCCL